MAVKKPKALTPAQRVRRVKDRKIAAGMVTIKIDVHPDDSEAVRKYAAKRPATKAAIKRFKES